MGSKRNSLRNKISSSPKNPEETSKQTKSKLVLEEVLPDDLIAVDESIPVPKTKSSEWYFPNVSSAQKKETIKSTNLFTSFLFPGDIPKTV